MLKKILILFSLLFLGQSAIAIDFDRISEKNRIYFTNLQKLSAKSQMSVLDKRLKIAVTSPVQNIELINDILFYFISNFEKNECLNHLSSIFSSASQVLNTEISSSLAQNLMNLVANNPNTKIYPFLKEYILKFDKSSVENRFEILSALKLLFFNEDSYFFYQKMKNEKNLPTYVQRNIKWQLLRIDIYKRSITEVQAEAEKLVLESEVSDDFLKSENIFFRSLNFGTAPKKQQIAADIGEELKKKNNNFWLVQNYAKIYLNIGEYKSAISVYKNREGHLTNIEKSIMLLDLLLAKSMSGEETDTFFEEGILFFKKISSNLEDNPYHSEFIRIKNSSKNKKYFKDKNVDNYWSHFLCSKEKKCS